MNPGAGFWLSSVRRWFALGLMGLAAPSLAADRASFGTSHLQRDLRGLSTRVERAPRAAAYDLKRVERRLHGQRIDTPRDPRLSNLEIETRHLRWQADRAGRRGGTGPAGAASVAIAAFPSLPRPVGGSHSGLPDRTADVGRRVIALQGDLRLVDEQLRRGEAVAAAALLAEAAAELELLRGLSAAITADPNLVALDRQIGALVARLSPSP
jgi:hypothetical protein